MNLGTDRNPLARDVDVGKEDGAKAIVVVLGAFFSSVGGGG